MHSGGTQLLLFQNGISKFCNCANNAFSQIRSHIINYVGTHTNIHTCKMYLTLITPLAIAT